MIDPRKELERMHKQIEESLRPFTLMLSSKNMSWNKLDSVCRHLEKALREMSEFVDNEGRS